MKTLIVDDLEIAVDDLCEEIAERGVLPLPIPPKQTKDEVLRAFARKLSFPEYFGRNLDAFADAMDDFVLSLVGSTALVVAVDPEFVHDEAFGVIEEILREAQKRAPSYSPLEVFMLSEVQIPGNAASS